MKTLIVRGLSGAVYVALVVFCTQHSFVALAGLFLIFQTVGVREFRTLTKALGHPVHYGALLFAVLALTTATIAFVMDEIGTAWLLVGVAMAIVFGSFVFEIFYPKKTAIINLGLFLLGFLYLSIPMASGLLLTTWEGSFDGFKVLSVFIIIWSFDTFAYLVGRKLGKRKLAPNVSPGKTLEGLAGGLLGALVTAGIIAQYNNTLPLTHWLILALILASTATLGDLFESRLKREAGLKDSGRFMPGHGGILDRLDSYLFSLPFVFLFYIIIYNF
jgi:phosphatidate cytidylyltransferase